MNQNDLSEVPIPHKLSLYEKQGSRAVQYGDTIFLQGGKWDTTIIDQLLEYKNKRKSIVVAFTGEPGTGKTWGALRLAEILDPAFKVYDNPEKGEKDNSQIVFSRSHLSYLTGKNSPLKAGQVIVIDETHFDWGSRTFQVKDQRHSVNYLSAIRSKGLILFFVVLNLSMLDRILREFLITWEIAVRDRGKGLAYSRKFYTFSKHSIPSRMGPIEFEVPDPRGCPSPDCLKCGDREKCSSLKAIYERKKKAFLDNQAEPEDIKSKETKTEVSEVIYNAILPTNRKYPVKVTTQENISHTDLVPYLEAGGYPTGQNYAREIARMIKTNHPELIQTLEGSA